MSWPFPYSIPNSTSILEVALSERWRSQEDGFESPLAEEHAFASTSTFAQGTTASAEVLMEFLGQAVMVSGEQ